MIAVVGAGLAGLTCARVLQKAGVEYLLLEASDAPGGRVRTDRKSGFLLDRGFQVILDSYPTLRRHVNLPKLNPRAFDSGALLWDRGRFWTLKNPLRHPLAAPGSALSGAFSTVEKFRLAGMIAPLAGKSDSSLLRQCGAPSDVSTLELLRQKNLSPACIERFFRPFFGGVFLENDLATSAGLFLYYLKKFSTGRALLPGSGVQALPELLASTLDPERVRFGARVVSLESRGAHVEAVVLDDGSRIPVTGVVLAGDAPAMQKLAGLQPPPLGMTPVWTVIFSSPRSLYSKKLIVLPAGKSRLVRHFVQITNIVPEYSPDDRHLIVATILDPKGKPAAALPGLAAAEIAEVFPAAAGTLTLVDVVKVEHAVFRQPPDFFRRKPASLPWKNVRVAGDHTATSSIEAAMASGESAALNVLKSQPASSSAG